MCKANSELMPCAAHAVDSAEPSCSAPSELRYSDENCSFAAFEKKGNANRSGTSCSGESRCSAVVETFHLLSAGSVGKSLSNTMPGRILYKYCRRTASNFALAAFAVRLAQRAFEAGHSQSCVEAALIT